jgi:hypothetical protein
MSNETSQPDSSEIESASPAVESEAAGNPEQAPSRRQKFWAFAFAGSGFLFVYVLSAGPMVAIHNAAKFHPFQRALEIVYAPIVLLVKSGIEPFAGLLKAYIEIFR